MTCTRIIHVSHNIFSSDNRDCGNHTRPCYSVTYALKMAGNDSGGTITLAMDCCYTFSVKEKISISIMDGSLELTSYCMDIECYGRRQKPKIETVAGIRSAIFSFISSSSLKKKLDFKVSNLLFKVYFKHNIILYDLQQNGVINV